MNIVRNCLNGDGDIKDFNSTCIFFIPKLNTPQTLNDYRPISLCNVTYKAISKLLVNRMKPYLSDLVDSGQSAFVRDCLMIDNIIVASEGFHWLNRGLGSNDKRPFAIKVDMSKAYNRIDGHIYDGY